ncbi:hypothetical protein Pen01_76700 [Phytomonospora endophytica]|nr:hypothetical protein Pen01_76700 [Phytomonospora endophytica]
MGGRARAKPREASASEAVGGERERSRGRRARAKPREASASEAKTREASASEAKTREASTSEAKVWGRSGTCGLVGLVGRGERSEHVSEWVRAGSVVVSGGAASEASTRGRG